MGPCQSQRHPLLHHPLLPRPLLPHRPLLCLQGRAGSLRRRRARTCAQSLTSWSCISLVTAERGKCMSMSLQPRFRRTHESCCCCAAVQRPTSFGMRITY